MIVMAVAVRAADRHDSPGGPSADLMH